MFWKNSNWEESDPHLKRLRVLPFTRKFESVTVLPGLYTIRGPRQIGKTSWLKTILSQEVRVRGAEKCFYMSCENIENRKELTELLKSLRGYEVILLDEVTYIKDWALSVKYEIDSGYTTSLFLTGSNSTDLRKGGEQLPGRFGEGGEYILLPMGINEFEAMRKEAGWKKISRDELLLQYFRVGGFPSALFEAGENGDIPTKSRETYKKWLLGDILKLGKREIYFREVIGEIANTLSTSISLQKIASKTQLGSHHTALEYIEILEDCFAIKTLYAIDPHQKKYRFRKNKKFYFTDPLIFWIALEFANLKVPANYEERLAEMVAHEEISRHFNKDKFGYLSSKKGEIDFFCPEKWAIEVKWADCATNLSKAYLDHNTTWKSVWVKNNYLSDWP